VDRRTARALVVAATTCATCLAAPAAQAEPGFAAADQAAIAPGALMITTYGDDSSTCTAGFVFAGGASVYLGYAAHCAGHGDPSGLSGCVASTLPLGSPVIIEGRDGRERLGRLAYSSWLTMQERGETDEARCFVNDFALVEITPADVRSVSPSVPGIGGPTGIDTDGLQPGEAVFSYQPNNGDLVPKAGHSLGDSFEGRSHRVVTSPAGGPGDSGSGYLDANRAAFGLLSTRIPDGRAVTNGVVDLAAALAYANRYGGIGPVALVHGTQPHRLA
jgi:hypothetical protein